MSFPIAIRDVSIVLIPARVSSVIVPSPISTIVPKTSE